MVAALRPFRVAVAALILTAVLVQFFTPDDPWVKAGNFLSFFTIQSNLLAAAVLALVALRGAPHGARLDLLRGAVTLYLLITGVVFALLLSNLPEELQLTRPWVDTVLHQITPIALVLDWVLDPPRTRIAPRTALLWLAYPAAYVVYTLVRGEIVDWYPYPFLDVGEYGYGAVLRNCVALLVGFSLAAVVVAAVGNLLGARTRRVAVA